MFEKIVVPVDLSDRACGAIRAAVALAAATRGRITLLHVIETLRGVEFEELEDLYLELRQNAQTQLEKWQAELSADTRMDFEIVYGSRAAEILRFVEERGADLVVLASHALAPELPHGGFGTLSHQVGLLAPCPVLLMR